MNAESSEIKRSPFRSGDSAYQGPQQLALAGAVRKALIASDSVVTVRGPVGVGKTASVIQAVRRTGNNSVIARIGRVRLEREDVLELLLNELGVQQMPTSALQRFTALKKALTDWAAEDTDVFVIVEDVERLGTEGLAELESLTAADSGATPGAHLVLMGTVDMHEFLGQPPLARLKQRVLRSMFFQPFSLDETRGYIEHCLNNYGAGEKVTFEPGAVDIVHGCSGGVARFINTVAENMIISAADSGAAQITRSMAREVASDCFGYEHDDAVLTEALPDAGPSSAPAANESPAADLPKDAANSPSADDEAQRASADELSPANDSTTEIDDEPVLLIQDTLPPTPAIDEAHAAAGPEPAARNSDVPPAGTRDGDAPKQKTEADEPEIPTLRLDPEEPVEAAGDNARAWVAPAEPGTRPEAAKAPGAKRPSAEKRPDQLRNTEPPPAEKSAQTPPAAAPDPAYDLNLDDPVPTSTLAEAFAESQLLEEEAKAAAAAKAANDEPAVEMKIQLEPKAPEPIVGGDNSDTQTRQALDDALRPDTQLLRTLDEESSPVEDEGPVPIGLADAVQPKETEAESGPAPKPGAKDAEADRPAAENNESAAPAEESTDRESTDSELGELEITLDASLEEKKKEAEAKLAEERKRREAAASKDEESKNESAKDAGSDDAGSNDESTDDKGQAGIEREQIELVESLSSRFSNAKSLEDVVDDKAAETLFGEEFSEMAAAVAAMANAQNLEPGDDSPEQATPAPATDEAADVESAKPESGELSLVAEEAPAPKPEQSAPAKAPAAPAVKAPPKPAAPPASPPNSAKKGAADGAGNLDSSPSQRLRMVRALSGKTGAPPVPANGSIGEEIVLGNSTRLKVEKGAKTSIPSKPVEGSDTSGEFDYIKDDDDEPKKKGFLSRFRKS